MPNPDSGLYAADSSTRLQSLIKLKAENLRPEPKGTNTHIHTNYSFSSFRSPAEAAWLAYSAGVEIFGINDHYTVDGHPEFRASCDVLNLPATFSIESVAMERQAEQAGLLLNDPGNPGRIYLCGKGVTRAKDPKATAMLASLRSHQEDRNKAMVNLVAQRFQRIFEEKGPTWDDIIAQTPLGNTTERHIARAIYNLLQNGDYAQRYQQFVGGEANGDAAKDQNAIRSALLKAGKSCYVSEAPEAYPALTALRKLYLQLGAIPTYPILGNPITAGEENLTAHCDRLAQWGIFALELIPSRNTEDRVQAVLDEAARRNWPVFDGTEHNTPVMEPLLTQWGSDTRFRQQFKEGALVLLGHQALCAQGESGYLEEDGKPTPNGRARCLSVGQQELERTLAKDQ